MKTKYPFVKRDMTKKEKDAMLSFVAAIVYFGVVAYLILSAKELSREFYALVAIGMTSFIGVIYIYLGFKTLEVLK
jgi:hypothetical protein